MNRSGPTRSYHRISRLVRNLVAVAATGALAAGVGAGCTHDNPSSISVPLTYRAKSNLNTAALQGQVPEAKLFVGPVMDERSAAQKDKIGENTEDDDAPPIPVMADGDVPEFLHQVLADQLATAGLTVVQSQAEADRVLMPTLNQFWVHEGGTYEGTVSATFTVNDKAGAKVWGPGKFSGAYGHFGKSKSAGNYQEAFSESSQKLVEQLLSNAGFRGSLKGAPARAGLPTGATTETPDLPRANPLVKKPAPSADPIVIESPAPPADKSDVDAQIKEIKTPAKEAAEDAKDATQDAKDGAVDSKKSATEAKDASDDANK